MAGTEHKGKLEIEIDNQKDKLKRIRAHNDIFNSLDADEKELKDLKNDWFFIRWFKGGTEKELQDRIDKTKKEIKDNNLEKIPLKEEKDQEDLIKTLQSAKRTRKANVFRKGLPEKMNKDVQGKYLKRFRELPQYIDEEVGCVNITMFGGIGVGKSSFLNTLVTALTNNPNKVYTDFKTAPFVTGCSKTKTFQLDRFKVDGTKELPIRFYDCPGIDEDEDRTMTLDVLEAVIKGHVNPESTFNPTDIRNEEGESYRQDPSLKHAMHCIAFVFRATTFIEDNPRDIALKKIKALQQKINGPRDVHQVVIITNMDKIGIPDVDLESVFRYSVVEEMFFDVSKCLGIEQRFIYPVANYDNETEPDAAKNALALMALWDIFEKGERHIQKKLENE